MSGVGDHKRYEYRLSFIQAFGNPSGAFVFRSLAIMLICLQIYGTIFPISYDPAVFAAAWVAALLMMGTSMFGLFYGRTRWTAMKWIEFTEKGIASNFGQLGSDIYPIDAQTVPYEFLKIKAGMFGILVIYAPACNGTFMLVPSHVISRSMIEKRFRTDHLQVKPPAGR